MENRIAVQTIANISIDKVEKDNRIDRLEEIRTLAEKIIKYPFLLMLHSEYMSMKKKFHKALAELEGTDDKTPKEVRIGGELRHTIKAGWEDSDEG